MSKNHNEENEKKEKLFECYSPWTQMVCNYLMDYRRMNVNDIKRLASYGKMEALNKEQLDAIADVAEFISKDKGVLRILEQVVALNLPVINIQRIRDVLYDMPDDHGKRKAYIGIIEKSLGFVCVTDVPENEFRIDLMNKCIRAFNSDIPSYEYEEFVKARSRKALVLMFNGVIKYNMSHDTLHVAAAYGSSHNQEKYLNREITKLIGKDFVFRKFK